MHQDTTDAALIRASRKDPAAFGTIFDRHWPRIYRYCVERAGPAAGEDVAAETFRVAFDHRKRYDGRDDAAPWLYGIASNLLRRWFRSAARGSRAMTRIGAEVTDEDLDDIVERLDAEYLSPHLRSVMAQLSPADRDTLLTQNKLIVATPALRERLWANQMTTQQLILQALGASGQQPSFQDRVTVAACLAAATTAILTWVENDGVPELPDLLDQAFGVLADPR